MVKKRATFFYMADEIRSFGDFVSIDLTRPEAFGVKKCVGIVSVIK
jgi:hypothetical protein